MEGVFERIFELFRLEGSTERDSGHPAQRLCASSLGKKKSSKKRSVCSIYCDPIALFS